MSSSSISSSSSSSSLLPSLASSSTFSSSLSSSQVSSPQQPRKRLKLSETQEKSTTFDANSARKQVVEYKLRRMNSVREKYVETVSELYFLRHGGNIVEYSTWRNRPQTQQFRNFLRQNRLDPEDDNEDLTAPSSSELSRLLAVTTAAASTIVATTSATVNTATANVTTVASGSTIQSAIQSQEVDTVSGTEMASVAISTSLPVTSSTSVQGNYKKRYFKRSKPLLREVQLRNFQRGIEQQLINQMFICQNIIQSYLNSTIGMLRCKLFSAYNHTYIHTITHIYIRSHIYTVMNLLNARNNRSPG